MPVTKVSIPDYKPSARQIRFHASEAFETLYGGAAGGGKTAALCAEAITSAIEEPGTHVFIFRRTLKELKQSVYNEIMQQIAPYQNLPDYQKAVINGKRLTISFNSQDSQFKFSNGSIIQLAYLDSVADRYNYMSAEIHLLLIDELTHFLEDDYEYLKTRVRSADNRRLRVMACTNPGNIGHGWVKNRFIVSKDPNVHYIPEVPYIDPVTENTRIFIPAKVRDHPSEIFRKSYMRVLNAIPDEQLRKALRDGDWDVFEGQVYTEWDKEKHVIEKLPVDLSVCKKYIGFDWGYNDWGCATWFAVAPENEMGVKHIYAYREIYDRQKTPKWWAEQIADIIQKEDIEHMILPHDCYSHLGGNQTIAKTFVDAGVPCVRANSLSHSAKLHRAALMHQLLAIADDGEPYLQYLKVCPNNIRTIPDLPYSETRPEEISDRAEDHAFDSSTYGLMVIMDGETWILGSDDQGNRIGKKESFIIDEYGYAQGLHIDIHKILMTSTEDKGRDWRYT
jgi:phage terminase large subunit